MSASDIKKAFSSLKGEVRFLERMSAHTSLGIGGPADVFVKPEDLESLFDAVNLSVRLGMPLNPVGGGTNILVGDKGVNGVIISTGAFNKLDVFDDEAGRVIIKAGAGVRLGKLMEITVRLGLAGMEGLAGIPGYLGGAVFGNAGAFGFEMKDVVVDVDVLKPNGETRTMAKDEIAFRYRGSAIPSGWIITGATIGLRKETPEDVKDKVEGFIKQKRKKQPLGYRSAGCVFKNPAGDIPPAGRLIEEAGLKGRRVGDIEVSSVHANFFINTGVGTSEDFIGLMDIVAGVVRERAGILLEPEIRIMGRC